MLLNETTDAAGVGSCVVFVLSTECRAVALSEDGADNEGRDDTDARTEGEVNAEPLKVLEVRNGSARTTEAFRSVDESVVVADWR